MQQALPMRILIAGATGLVGQGVLQETLSHPGIDRIGLLGRRSVGRADPRIDELLVPGFDALDGVAGRLGGWDACFYCAGAPPVGTPEATYRHVTLDLTLRVARAMPNAIRRAASCTFRAHMPTRRAG